MLTKFYENYFDPDQLINKPLIGYKKKNIKRNIMSSVRFKTASEEKMSMYENMVEDLVGDENSRYILDGKWRKRKINKLF